MGPAYEAGYYIFPSTFVAKIIGKSHGKITYACSSGSDTTLERERQRLNFWRFCSVDSGYTSYLWERTILLLRAILVRRNTK
jgi:hypothetical protein